MIKKNTFETKEQWLKQRTSCIGGSDAASILGLNKYKSNVELWEEKVGIRVPEDISNKPYVKYGTEAEKYLRELFKLDYPEFDVIYEENNMIINDKVPFAHASLDGELFNKESKQKGILEIKTSTIHNSLGWKNWENKIPDNYYIQCLHYLMVTEYDFVCLKAKLMNSNSNSRNANIRHYFIYKEDVLEDIEYLRKKEQEFYECIVNKREPNLILPEI